MENNSFKTVAFGGFDRQDVIAYIERTARDSAAAQSQLQQENDGLRAEVRDLSGKLEGTGAELAEAQDQLAEIREQLREAEAARDGLRAELEEARQELEGLRARTERLAAEAESLRPDAEAYVRFRDQIGSIECEARQRAAHLEDESGRRLRQVAERFRAQYRSMMETFEATASHVNGELRKMEVTLTQLPRAMDQSGADLESLSSLLEDGQER